VRVLLALVALVVVAASAGAGRIPDARAADPSVFGGLGTWIDIYDGPQFRTPEQTAQRIAARGVDVVWIETSNYGAKQDVVRPVALARLVDALHALGIRVVAWYLPGHGNPNLDLRRSRAMLAFRTPAGGVFDGVALDIESTKVQNVPLRSRRAVALARRVREEAGNRPLAIVPFNPRGLERNPRAWPGFPWVELAQVADAFAPMVYTGGSLRGFDATYGYVTRALRLLRVETGRPDVRVHVVEGVANRLGPEELAGFAAAVDDDGGTIGVSLYDWATTPSATWPVLQRLNG
jgi:hypothetical protein